MHLICILLMDEALYTIPSYHKYIYLYIIMVMYIIMIWYMIMVWYKLMLYAH